MVILYFILALFACVLSAAIGAFGMRFVIERNREIAEREDPRDTQIRDLQSKIRLGANEQKQNRMTAASATEHVQFAHDRIAGLLGEVQHLKNTLQTQEDLRGEHDEEKDLLRDKLSAATRQVDTFRQRIQELEVELSIMHEPDMLSESNDDSEADHSEADPFTPVIEDNSPSLIQSLSGELERWKRHCHVLGDELKNQRERVSETSDSSLEPATAVPEFDELTDIRGIGAVLARKLHMLGIYRFADLLNLSDDDRERAQQLIPDFERRMKRDDWLEQAQMLHANKPQQGTEQPDAGQTDYAAQP